MGKINEEYPQPDWGGLIGMVIGLILGLVVCACLGSCKSKEKVETVVSTNTDSVFRKVDIQTDSMALFSKWLRSYIDTSTIWEFSETTLFDTDKADSNGVSPILKIEKKAKIKKNGKHREEKRQSKKEIKKSTNHIVANSVNMAAITSTKRQVSTKVNNAATKHKGISKWYVWLFGVLIGILLVVAWKNRKKIVKVLLNRTTLK